MATLGVGLFGPSLCGKTTLGKTLSRGYYLRGGIRSIVLDPNLEKWGPQAFVTADRAVFFKMVKAERSCAVYIEESSEMLDRDSEMTWLFTRIRHYGHRIHVSGHSGMSLLPVMREQLQTLAIFRVNEDALKIWARLFSEKKIFQASTLKQYEFLWCELYKEPRLCKLQI